jgi:hypothetical protein
MRRILRRYVTRDSAGRPISVQSERLTDDGAGRLQLNNERTARMCSGCRRPVIELSELRGLCHVCGARECCLHCASRCQVCARQLCGGCRRGFAGPPPLTICAPCRQRLIERQVRQDDLDSEQTAFDRYVAQHRLYYQVEALRLAEERMRIMAQFQEARLNMGRRTKLQWVMHLLGLTVITVFKGFQYVVRRALP